MKRAFCRSRTLTNKAPIGTRRGRRWRKQKIDGADDGIRTRDLRFTKPLLYQLSYIGAERAKIASAADRGKRKIDNHGSSNVSPISRRAMRSGSCCSAATKRSIGSRNGSKLSRNV